MFSVSATNCVMRPCFMYGVRSENFCVLGFSVGSNFVAACMTAPFNLGLLIVDTIDLQIVQVDDVLPHDLIDDRLGQMAELIGDHLTRVRPGRGGVWIIARPHKIIFTEPVHHAPAAWIAEEGCIDLLAHVFACLLYTSDA